MKDILGRLDKVLDDSLLLSEPRAVLLISVCQILRVVEPDILKNIGKTKSNTIENPRGKERRFKALKGFDAVNRRKNQGVLHLAL